MDKYDEFYKTFEPSECPVCGSKDIYFQMRLISGEKCFAQQQWFCNGHNWFFHVYRKDFLEWIKQNG